MNCFERRTLEILNPDLEKDIFLFNPINAVIVLIGYYYITIKVIKQKHTREK